MSELIAEKERVNQVVKMCQELQGELRHHSGNKNSLIAAYEIVKNNEVVKPTQNYFLLSKEGVMYCYEMAIGKRNLAHKETVRANFLRVLQLRQK